ncbi:hypothetical protein GCM10029978_066140 [Actinoallomurus acanthiterrae]
MSSIVQTLSPIFTTLTGTGITVATSQLNRRNQRRDTIGTESRAREMAATAQAAKIFAELQCQPRAVTPAWTGAC